MQQNFLIWDARKVPQREVRLAVTMVGGTSLAVYECGVAQELFLMVHGAGLYGLLKRLTQSDTVIDILSGTSAGGINTICLSAALANGTDFRILRDVWISLAGVDSLMQNPSDRGVQAIFKGNGYYLDTLTDAFDKLTDRDRAPYAGSGVRSFDPGSRDLDLFVTGTYYDGQPRAYFDSRNKPIFTYDYGGVFHLEHRGSRGESHFNVADREPGEPSEDSAETNPLYQTGNSGRRTELYRRLARVARTTSSLPAVFEPSAVDPGLMNGIIELPRDLPESYMLDGGFLNNKPIDLVLKEIYARSADAEVLRKVVFVEPQPEGYRAPSTRTAPSALESVLFYKDVPGRQSLSVSLESVSDHNLRARRVSETLEAIRGMLRADVPLAPQQYNLWVDTCLRDLRGQLVACWERALGLEGFGGLESGGWLSEAEEKARREKAGDLRVVRADLLDRMRAGCRDFVYERVPAGAETEPGPAPNLIWSNRPAQFGLDDIDTSFLARKITNAIQEVYGALYPVAESAGGDSTQEMRRAAHAALGPDRCDFVRRLLQLLYFLRDVVDILNRNIFLVLGTMARSVVYADAARRIRSGEPHAEAVDALWSLIVGCLRELLGPFDALDALIRDFVGDSRSTAPAVTPEMFKNAFSARSKILCDALEKAKGIDDLRSRIDAGRTPFSGNLVVADLSVRIDRTVRLAAEQMEPGLRRTGENANTARHGGPPIPLIWALDAENADGIKSVAGIGEKLRLLDVFLLPIEQAAGLLSRNQVEVVHVSPRDVQTALSEADPRTKVAGDVLANLGGFFKRSWRANDILWGRLDGAGAIIDTLLDRDRLLRLIKEDPGAWETALRAIRGYVLRGDFLAGEETTDASPDDGIGALLRPECEQFEKALRARLAVGTDLTGADADALRNLLLRRCQYEIVYEEVPIVVAEAVAEHAVWQGGGEADSLRLRARGASSDPGSVGDAALIQATELARISGNNADGTIRRSLQEAARAWARGLFHTGTDEKQPPTPEGAERTSRYFALNYAVGQETLQGDIPPLITLHRLVGGLLVTLHVLNNAMTTGFKAGPVGNLLTRFVLGPLSLVIGALYGFVTLLAQNSAAAAATHAALWSVIALALALWLLASTPILVPLAGLALLCELCYWWVRRSARQRPTAATGKTDIVLALVALAAWGAFTLRSVLVSRFLGIPDPLTLLGLPDSALFPVAAGLIVATRALMLALTNGGRGLRTETAPRGIVSLELAGTGNEVKRILASWDDQDQAAWANARTTRRALAGPEPDFEREYRGKTRDAARKNLRLDFLFLVVYSVTMAFLCALAARAPVPPSWLPGWTAAGHGLAYLQVPAGLFDAAENVFLLRMVGGAVGENAARAARLCARAKFTLVFLGLAYALIGGGFALSGALGLLR